LFDIIIKYAIMGYIKVLNCKKCGTPIAREFYSGLDMEVRCPRCDTDYRITPQGDLEELRRIKQG
jgi:phage FluMu protein Com